MIILIGSSSPKIKYWLNIEKNLVSKCDSEPTQNMHKYQITELNQFIQKLFSNLAQFSPSWKTPDVSSLELSPVGHALAKSMLA